MVERSLRMREATGSIPVLSISFVLLTTNNWPLLAFFFPSSRRRKRNTEHKNPDVEIANSSWREVDRTDEGHPRRGVHKCVVGVE